MKIILILIISLITAISALNSRIVGGEIAEPTQFPFYCTVYSLNQENPKRCGASITTSNWILTAAQCIYNNNEESTNNYQVHCGRWNLLETSENEQIRTTNLEIIHPNFNPNDFFSNVYYDIGLVSYTKLNIVS